MNPSLTSELVKAMPDCPGVFIDTITVAFVVNGQKRCLFINSPELAGLSFERGNEPPSLRINQFPATLFDGLDEVFEVFGPVSQTTHTPLFDVYIRLVKEGGEFHIEESSITLSSLRIGYSGEIIPEKDFDQELLKPLKEAQILSVITRTVVKGRKK